MIFAIDPGNEYSAYVLLDEDLKPIAKGKIDNVLLLYTIPDFLEHYPIRDVAIEMVASYGMAVGKTVFDTCVWIGRFYQMFVSLNNEKYHSIELQFIYRKDEKMCLCGSMKAKDSNIIQALVDRFAPYTPNKGKGTKNNQGVFYGFKKDIWQAMAVGVTYHDLYLEDRNTTKIFL